LRSVKEFVTDIVRKPPILFPLVALAHVVWLLWTIWNDRSAPFGGIEWLQVLWLLGYTICWITASDFRKWGAIGYMLLTMVNITLFLTVKNYTNRDLYMSNMFLLDGVFSFFLLFYFKRFT